MAAYATAALLPLLLAVGCATTPTPTPDAAPGIKQYRQAVGTGYEVDFSVETRVSRIDGKSCYALISGALSNHLDRSLSRRSALQFLVYHGDTLLFRDLTYPRTDVPPASRIQFELVESPLHHKHCPSYDRIEVRLTPIPLR